ncbi:MAG TPA: TraR/DksA C4-type zinc finger protein [Anaeromyxobacteraceae bacterium]|nr:TraR/DksA C4-type zinc finger protein [Anaeromyxobacteraceae bacterium]
MAQIDLAEVREELLRRRRRILDSTRRAAAEIEAMQAADRDPEFEEGAQREHEQYTLSRLSETQRREFDQIDAAIARIDAGTYGVCRECGQEIEPRRLAALPYAVLCAEDAAREEQRVTPLPSQQPPTL